MRRRQLQPRIQRPAAVANNCITNRCSGGCPLADGRRPCGSQQAGGQGRATARQRQRNRGAGCTPGHCLKGGTPLATRHTPQSARHPCRCRQAAHGGSHLAVPTAASTSAASVVPAACPRCCQAQRRSGNTVTHCEQAPTTRPRTAHHAKRRVWLASKVNAVGAAARGRRASTRHCCARCRLQGGTRRRLLCRWEQRQRQGGYRQAAGAHGVRQAGAK